MEVYNNVQKIGKYEKVPHNELQPVLLAALFHDSGHAFRFQGHEDVSATYSKLYMEKNGYDENAIKKVDDCIKATKIPQIPINIWEQIICDADLFHLGTYVFYTKNKDLRKEWSRFMDINYTDEDWLQLNIGFLPKHHFHTSYGKEILDPIKQENIILLENELHQYLQ